MALAMLAVALVAGWSHQSLLIDAPIASGSVEWDFYYSYAVDAKRIASLLPPLDVFRGPLYPLVVALGGIAVPSSSLFTVAKVVSAISAMAAVYAAYLIGEELVGSAWGLAVATTSAFTAPFLLHGFLVGTDMFFAALSLFTVLLVLRAQRGNATAAIGAGVLAGLALSTRWNAAYLPVAAVAAVLLTFDRPIRARLRIAALLVLAFTLTAAPHLAFNWTLHGNPLFNRNYVNIALGIYDGQIWFGSLSEALGHAPSYFLQRWATNVAVYAGRVGAVILPFAAFAATGVILLAISGRQRSGQWACLLFLGGLFAINAVGPFVPRQYLLAIPLLLVAAAVALQWMIQLGQRRAFIRAAPPILWTACALWVLQGGTNHVLAVLDTEAMQAAAQRAMPTGPATPLLGDWDGDGRDEPALVRNGKGYRVFYVFPGFVEGPARWIVAYGPEDSIPLAGRWAGGDADGIGAFSRGGVFLKHAAFSGRADVTTTFDDPDAVPIVGDWDGDGRDGLGTFHNGQFVLSDRIEEPGTVRTFSFGAPGAWPIAGDWDCDGVDTVAIYHDEVVTLTNRAGPPFDDVWQVRSPRSGAIALGGDWDGDGCDAPVFYADDGSFLLPDGGPSTLWKADLTRLSDLPALGE